MTTWKGSVSPGGGMGDTDQAAARWAGCATIPAAPPVDASLRIGVDVTVIAEVAASIATFGSRYVERIFTAHEIATCAGEPPVFAAGLAARFAAKEATLKVLRPAVRPAWTSIEVRKDPEGWCALHLTGAAARLADDAGITNLALSLSRAGGLATAVVVASAPPAQEGAPWTT